MNKPPRDLSAHRLPHLVARRLVDLAQPKPGSTVLVLEASSSVLAAYASPKVGPTGKVIRVAGSANRELCAGDLLHLPFADATFDCVLCPLTIYLLPDMAAGLCEWRRVLKPGGIVALSGYGERSFQPLVRLFETCLRRYGVNLSPRPFAWQRLTDLEAFSDSLRNAAFSVIDVRGEQLGHYLANGDEWWELVWSSDLRKLLDSLSPDVLAQFKTEHLAALAELATERGIWLNGTVIFAVGQKG